MGGKARIIGKRARAISVLAEVDKKGKTLKVYMMRFSNPLVVYVPVANILRREYDPSSTRKSLNSIGNFAYYVFFGPSNMSRFVCLRKFFFFAG